MVRFQRADGAPLVKICGLRRVEDMVATRDAGADLIGFVFAPSQRQVSVDVVRTMLTAVPGHPPAVGVFVDAPIDEVEMTARTVGLAYIQLSGQESAEDAAPLTLPYIKVIHRRAGDPLDPSLHIMNSHRAAAAFLIDSASLRGGGSGRVIDWKAAAEIVRRADRPVLLAGGLTPANVAAGLAETGAHGVDVSSGVERNGWKDADLIRQFVQAARRGNKDDRPAADAQSLRDETTETEKEDA